MKVAIIGSDNVGSAVAEAAKQAGHEITVASPEPERREGLGDSLGVGTTSSNVDAVEDAEVVVLAVLSEASTTLSAR
jgi:pyrroline-5-carboxylate reductase